MMALVDYGWTADLDEVFRDHAAAGLVPGRIVRQSRDVSLVVTSDGEQFCEVSGRFRRTALGPSAFPAVGDWAALRPTPDGRFVIEALLPRTSAFSRKAPGNATEAQIVAANVDVVLLVSGLDGDFDVRRIERYVATAWSSGAQPVIVLNKSDLSSDLDAAVTAAAAVAPGVPILTTTAVTSESLAALRAHLDPGRTIALLGSSGVGKSTLVNSLLGEERLATNALSSARRGRHTTTARELVRLPDGALLIDTPGMRELGLWIDEDALQRTFHEIDDLAQRCRFTDCAHHGEPGCAVEDAVARGAVEPDRLESYLALRREMEFLETRKDEMSRRRQERSVGRDFAARRQELRRNGPRRTDR